MRGPPSFEINFFIFLFCLGSIRFVQASGRLGERRRFTFFMLHASCHIHIIYYCVVLVYNEIKAEQRCNAAASCQSFSSEWRALAAFTVFTDMIHDGPRV
jgi:hypothetical protein